MSPHLPRLYSHYYNFYRRLVDRTPFHLAHKYPISSVGLSDILADYDCAIVHAGLRSVSSSSASDAFDLLSNALSGLDNLFIPGFTPSFRSSGIYSVKYSRPEVGSFSKLAWLSGAPRTLDPIHSLFSMRGSLSDVDISNDTFHPNGFFRTFIRKQSCIINIGTPHLISTLFHFYERYMNTPYLASSSHDGFILDSSQHPIPTHHYSYRYHYSVSWNRAKIESFLFCNGALTYVLWNGAYCRILDGQLAFELLTYQLGVDPYFMITF